MTEFSNASDNAENLSPELPSLDHAVEAYQLLKEQLQSGDSSLSPVYEDILLAEVVDAAAQAVLLGHVSYDEATRIIQDLGMTYTGGHEEDYDDLLEALPIGQTIGLRRLQSLGFVETGTLKSVHLVPYSPGTGKTLVPALVISVETDKDEPDIEELVEFSVRQNRVGGRRYIHPRVVTTAP